MAIKMRTARSKDLRCDECNVKYQNTRDMIEILVSDKKFALCYKCYNELFNKLLKIQCDYQGKVKSKEDMERIERESRIVNMK